MVKIDKCYKLFGKIVCIDDIVPFGAEFQVFYINEDGKKDFYVGDNKDIDEDFEETSETIEFKVEKEKEQEENIITKPGQKLPEYYKIMFYVGGTGELVEKNIANRGLAYALRANLIKTGRYTRGKLKVELQ